VHVRGLPGGIGRQRATALGHHAQPAKHEHLRLAADLGIDRRDLADRQHTPQHDPLDAERLDMRADGVGVRGRRLN
jgi:hypothetical protein